MAVEPPQNGGYLVAAYVVASVILAGYWLRLWGMARKSVGDGQVKEEPFPARHPEHSEE